VRECNLFEKNMKSCRKTFKRIFTTLLFIHLDFNQAKMPSGENELDRLGGTHPESKKKKGSNQLGAISIKYWRICVEILLNLLLENETK
jgi:hypothetical protein